MMHPYPSSSTTSFAAGPGGEKGNKLASPTSYKSAGFPTDPAGSRVQETLAGKTPSAVSSAAGENITSILDRKEALPSTRQPTKDQGGLEAVARIERKEDGRVGAGKDQGGTEIGRKVDAVRHGKGKDLEVEHVNLVGDGSGVTGVGRSSKL